MLCARDGTPLAEEVTGFKRPDIIGPGHLALGWWVRWGEGWGLGVIGRGVAYFLPQTCADIYHTGIFLLIVPVGLKGQQFQNCEVTNEKKTYKGCFLSIMVNKFRIFIKNLRNTYELHFTNS